MLAFDRFALNVRSAANSELIVFFALCQLKLNKTQQIAHLLTYS